MKWISDQQTSLTIIWSRRYQRDKKCMKTTKNTMIWIMSYWWVFKRHVTLTTLVRAYSFLNRTTSNVCPYWYTHATTNTHSRTVRRMISYDLPRTTIDIVSLNLCKDFIYYSLVRASDHSADVANVLISRKNILAINHATPIKAIQIAADLTIANHWV